jgi:glycosyltransferase involved in cell wall biosynthesis
LPEKLKILFLPKWYPNRFDPMPGLFIRRQAEAVAAHCDVAVLYTHAVPDAGNRYEVDLSDENGIHTVIIYYRVPSKGVRGLTSIISAWRFFRAFLIGFRFIRSFEPDLLHVHVLTRLGVIAGIRKLFHGTPYLVSEHWSRYYPENGTYRGFLRKMATRCVVRNSAGLITVSGRLKDIMAAHGLKHRNSFLIPNVVDFSLFMPGPPRPSTGKKKIVHVSCFEDRSKNISGFLAAVKQLSLIRQDFECFLVGEGPDLNGMKSLAVELGIMDAFVTFTGLRTGQELAAIVSSSDFMVLSSRYETFGTVVVEALACGLPVVATNVGIVPEIITPGDGLTVRPGDDVALKDAIREMLDRCRTFDKNKIRATAFERFNSDVVGRELYRVYTSILPPKVDQSDA